MRKIQLRRGDKLVGELDLYDLLLQGDKSKDQRLQSGDVIFIPPVGPVAAIAGRVKTPAVYELEPGRTTLADLVRYAGGPTTTAARQSVLLERLDRKVGRVVEELPWDESSLNNRLEDGAVVTLRPISERFDNAVTLRGHVAFPVRTAWREGLRVSDLIRDRSVLVPESYWQRIASRAYPQPPPTEVPASPAEPAKTEVQSLFDEVNWDFAIVERLDRETLAPRLLPFDLGKAVIERDPADDLVLAPGDVVTVFSKRDVLPPVDRRTYFVLIEGEVVTPGIYQVAPGETLRQLVSRAGGFTDNAYLFGSEFTRRSVQAEQKERLQEIATRAEQDLETAGTEQLARAVSPEDVAATRHQLEEQRRAIARLRALKPTGRMVLAVDAKARTPEELPDLTLEDGDRLYVPMRSSVVGVYGAVYKQGNFVHEPGKPLEEYLRLAGGPTRAADKGSVYLLRADGSVISKRQSPWFADFEGTRLMPSDNIVVPQQYAPTSWVKELKDWTQILYQFGLGAAALKTLTQ
jgi:protein involved in polysaccharide export with SLBB domain